MSQELIRHILIVDDQRSAARALRDRLAAADPSFSVIDIPSGEEALLEIQQRDFDLVISDSRLSGMSGAEFMANALRRKEDLRFFVLTGYSLDEVQEAYGGQDVLAFFEKPVDMAALVEAVGELLLGEAASLPAVEPVVEPAVEPADAPIIEPAEATAVEPAIEPAEATAVESAEATAIEPADAIAVEPAVQPAADPTTRIVSLLADIRAELEVSAVAVADQDGRVLGKQAAPDAPQRFDDLIYRLSSQPDETAAVFAVLGDTPVGSITFYAGVGDDLFAVSASQGERRYSLVVAVRSGTGRSPGEVVNVLYRVGLEGLTTLLSEVEEAASGLEDQHASPESEAAPDQEAEYVPPFIDFDLENIDRQLDTGALDSFWEEEASRDTLNGDVLSMDEAIELGLIPEELNNDDE